MLKRPRRRGNFREQQEKMYIDPRRIRSRTRMMMTKSRKMLWRENLPHLGYANDRLLPRSGLIQLYNRTGHQNQRSAISLENRHRYTGRRAGGNPSRFPSRGIEPLRLLDHHALHQSVRPRLSSLAPSNPSLRTRSRSPLRRRTSVTSTLSWASLAKPQMHTRLPSVLFPRAIY
jgi:hypothetical protein